MLLVVEVLDGLGAATIMARKRAAYAAAEVPAYWLIDPDKPTMPPASSSKAASTRAYAEGPVVEVDWPLAVTFDVAEVARPQAALRS